MDRESRWSVADAHSQRSFRIRIEWGLAGARTLAPDADIAIVVDVLSFTTALSVAIDAGIEVLPYQWKDASAARYAEEHGATLAVSRLAAKPGQVSLSAGSIRQANDIRRLVLPSPNGSTIACHLAAHVPIVIGCSLRNASAVARWVSGRHDRQTTTIAIIPAGEQWPDGALRPAIEDLLGAGAVVSALMTHGWGGFSPEAFVAAAAFKGVSRDLPGFLSSCSSGKELIENGFGDDVDVAAEIDSSHSVPLMLGNRFAAE